MPRPGITHFSSLVQQLTNIFILYIIIQQIRKIMFRLLHFRTGYVADSRISNKSDESFVRVYRLKYNVMNYLNKVFFANMTS